MDRRVLNKLWDVAFNLDSTFPECGVAQISGQGQDQLQACG
jgi:hypothetical protein